jgi:hypothetical protein
MDSMNCALDILDSENWCDVEIEPMTDPSNPEKEMIKKDLFQKLNPWSKKIVDIIFNGDDDLLRMLTTPKTGNVTKRSLMIYLQEIGAPVRMIGKSFKELRVLANSL